jgi:2,4-dienoyl-CoA reductase-like NADH-dependent reductase (Old Yellow Enzyme family)
MAKLFEPLSLRSLTLKNRIGVSPMCMYSSQDGHAQEFHVVHQASRAVGGAALVITEATGVEARGRITPYCMGIWSDSHIAPLAKVVEAVKAAGAIAGIQLAHAGRKASTDRPWGPTPSAPLDEAHGGWRIVAPSAIPFSEKHQTPHALTVPEIKEIQAAFVAAARRSLSAGYQLIELHGAHGYLAHEFLSPLSNKREDEYGGSFDARLRFLLETVALLRQSWPEELPMGVRLSCSDWTEGGWTLEDTVALAKKLKAAGVDFVDCSSGGNVLAKIPVGPGYQVPFADAVKNQAGIPSAAVGLITEPAQANEILETDKADFVLLAREMLRDPYFANHAAFTLRVPGAAALPPQYARAGELPKMREAMARGA